ncbi:MAG: hypothetical protein M3511_15555, partial [Deinococcota bacterium]|nr:hypothetical protein [Deinococcota bacterium]
PGALIDYDPPLHELPAEAALRVGASWGGVTTAQLFFPQAREENQRAEVRLDYRYTVVDRRNVSVAAGDFDVFVINLEGRRFDDEGLPRETLRQELWFAPYIGEVRTRTGFFLVAANFQTAGP